MSAIVSAADRRRDRIALAIFAAGALLYLLAYAGMNYLKTAHLVTVTPHQQERRFTLYWELSRLGLLIAIIGAFTMAWSYLRYRARPAEPNA